MPEPIGRWLDRRAALRCVKAMHNALIEEGVPEKDVLAMAAEAWLWTIAGEAALAEVFLRELGEAGDPDA